MSDELLELSGWSWEAFTGAVMADGHILTLDDIRGAPLDWVAAQGIDWTSPHTIDALARSVRAHPAIRTLMRCPQYTVGVARCWVWGLANSDTPITGGTYAECVIASAREVFKHPR